MTRTSLLRGAVAALAVCCLPAGCSGAPPREAARQAPVTARPAVAGRQAAGPTADPTSDASGPVRWLTGEVVDEVRAAIEQEAQRSRLPCVAYSVSQGFSTITWEDLGAPLFLRSVSAGLGEADLITGEPCGFGSQMRIGTLTTTFTVTALLRLVDQGRIALDDPVARYVEGVPNGERITLRHLAGMRSGLFPYTVDQDFTRARTSDPRRRFTPHELLAYSFKHPVAFEPGAGFQNSATDTVLIGLAVEKVTGRPLGTVLQQEVFDPAALTAPLFPTDAAHPERMAHGYATLTPDGKLMDATDWNPSWAWASGAMICDGIDLRTWADVLATGSLLHPTTRAARMAMLPTGRAGVEYGLGISGNHGWVGYHGTLPGYESLVLWWPGEPRTTIVLQTTTDFRRWGEEPLTTLAGVITELLSPDHVYGSPPQPGVPGALAPAASAPASPGASPSSSPSPGP